MKISRLIEELQKTLLEKGDIEVVYTQDGFGGHADHLITGVSEWSCDSYVSDDSGDRDYLIEKLKIETDKNGTFPAIVLTGEMINVS